MTTASSEVEDIGLVVCGVNTLRVLEEVSRSVRNSKLDVLVKIVWVILEEIFCKVSVFEVSFTEKELMVGTMGEVGSVALFLVP